MLYLYYYVPEYEIIFSSLKTQYYNQVIQKALEDLKKEQKEWVISCLRFVMMIKMMKIYFTVKWNSLKIKMIRLFAFQRT